MSTRGLPALLLLVLLSACAPAPASPTSTFTAPPAAFTPAPAGSALPDPAAVTEAAPDCTDGLSFLQDLSVPDGSLFLPGERVDKRWLVENTGTCDWGEGYRLRLVDGEALGAPDPMALFPARAGAQAELRIVFTAPDATGTYQSFWQAHGPDGQPFGDIFYMEIKVP